MRLTVLVALVGIPRGAVAQDTASIRGRWTAFGEVVETEVERQEVPSWFGAADRQEAFASLRRVGDILRRAPGIVEPVGFDVLGVREVDFRDEPFDTRKRRPIPGFVEVSPSDYRHREDGSLGTSKTPDTPSLSVVMNSFQCLLRTAPNGEREHVFTLEHRDGSFRGYPRYANGCVLITRPGAPAPFVPVSRGEWLRLLIAQLERLRSDLPANRREAIAAYRADSARRAKDTTLEDMVRGGQMTAEQARQIRTAMLETERQVHQAMMEASTPHEDGMDAQLKPLSAALAALSPAEQAAPAYLFRERSRSEAADSSGQSGRLAAEQASAAYSAQGRRSRSPAPEAGLTTPDDPDGYALVRENPAFFDRSRPAGRPQVFTVRLYTVYSFKEGPASRAARQAFEGLDLSALAALLP